MALERQGFEIQRIALRGWDTPALDDEDRRERKRTRYVLRNGALALVLPLLGRLIRSPMRFIAALSLARVMARVSPDRSIFYHFAYLAEACQVASWVREFGAKHIHAHFGTNSAEVAMLARVLGGPPYSFTVHGPDEFLQPMGLTEKVHRSEFVVAISCYGRSQLYLRLPHEDWPKVQVIHCGLEEEFYNVLAVPVPEASRLVCVGRLSEAKGQIMLLQALARLNAKHISAELVLAGDGPLRNELQRLIKTLGIDKQVRITGWISSSAVRDEILAARALVLPSFAEGLPVVIMEAMALRRPVLATYVAGIPELVIPGETGWLFPAGSLNDLTEALETCLSTSTKVLQTFGDAGYGRVIARHSIDVEAGKLAALFNPPAPSQAGKHV